MVNIFFWVGGCGGPLPPWHGSEKNHKLEGEKSVRQLLRIPSGSRETPKYKRWGTLFPGAGGPCVPLGTAGRKITSSNGKKVYANFLE